MLEVYLNQIIEQGLEYVLSTWWYWLPAGLGIIFRIGIQYRGDDVKDKFKKIIRDILIIFSL